MTSARYVVLSSINAIWDQARKELNLFAPKERVLDTLRSECRIRAAISAVWEFDCRPRLVGYLFRNAGDIGGSCGKFDDNLGWV